MTHKIYNHNSYAKLL